jgi:hypothetical protein
MKISKIQVDYYSLKIQYSTHKSFVYFLRKYSGVRLITSKDLGCEHSQNKRLTMNVEVFVKYKLHTLGGLNHHKSQDECYDESKWM